MSAFNMVIYRGIVLPGLLLRKIRSLFLLYQLRHQWLIILLLASVLVEIICKLLLLVKIPRHPRCCYRYAQTFLRWPILTTWYLVYPPSCHHLYGYPFWFWSWVYSKSLFCVHPSGWVYYRYKALWGLCDVRRDRDTLMDMIKLDMLKLWCNFGGGLVAFMLCIAWLPNSNL